jgi:hypothetical protein
MEDVTKRAPNDHSPAQPLIKTSVNVSLEKRNSYLKNEF